MEILWHSQPTTDDKRLHDLALTRAQKYLECEARLLETIDEIDLKRVYERFGMNSTFAYCTQHLKLSEATTYNFINVCRKMRQVPELKIAIDEGRLTVPKARKIVPVINEENQAEWIEKASTLTQTELERSVANASPAQKVLERAKPCGPELMKLELPLTVAEFDAFQRARDIFSQKIGRAATAQEMISAQTEAYLEKHDPVRKAARVERKIKQRKESIVEKGSEKVSESGSEKGAEGARGHQQRAADSVALPSKNLSQEQLKHPRRKPLRAAVKRAVDLRDNRKCQSCGSTRWIHYHHLRPLHLNGTDTPENLVTLCSSCHRRQHPPTFAGRASSSRL